MNMIFKRKLIIPQEIKEMYPISEAGAACKKANDEELSNLAISLCRQVDVMLTAWLKKLEEVFKEEGGLSERMTAVRLGRRQTQKEIIEAQAHEIEMLKRRIAQLEAENKRLSNK